MKNIKFLVLIILSISLIAVACSSGGGGSPSAEEVSDSTDSTNSTDPTDSSLSGISLSTGGLDQVFQPSQTQYTATVGFLGNSITVRPLPANPLAEVRVNDIGIALGSASQPLVLSEGTTPVTVLVTSEDGSSTRTYRVEITRQNASQFAQKGYFKPSPENTVPGYGRNIFGLDVALSGDTLAVGINTTGLDVFVRKQGVWELQTTIPLQQVGVLGHVALDGNTLAIGSPNSSSTVAIYTRKGDTWSQQQVITLPNDGGGTGFFDISDNFGEVLALSGDTLVVGAPAEDSIASGINGDESDNSLPDSGAVFVYHRSGGVWSKQAYIKASNPGSKGIGSLSGDNFGKSVAISGDTLVVGAPNEDTLDVGPNGDNAGAVYVFTRINGIWTQQEYLKEPPTGSSRGFGKSVAVSGNTLVANGTNISDSRVHIFIRNDNVWSFQASLGPSNENNGGGGHFYRHHGSIAIDGDTLVVGGIDVSDSTGINGSELPGTVREFFGTVYVYQRIGNTWMQQYYIKPENITTNAFEKPGSDNFGFAVDVSGGAVAVGAFSEDSASTGVNGDQTDNSDRGSGAAYVFQ